ncbi:MAG: heme/copper-type cytochrome/quinol oxidase subunit 2 [uncultured bacterium]|nr:MAG: heme/copper-type cytochrome/quinol oxidase subunit 2 [uncultured bacterium]
MSLELHSALVSPKGVWWTKVGPQEKKWVIVSFVWCMILFAMMPLWHFKGGQNPSGIRGTVTPAEYMARVERFVGEYKVGELKGLPVVAPPPGSDVYLLGRMWSWYPVIKLKKDTEYTLHLSSTDVNHGFSLYPVNVNFQVVPGYDHALKIKPNEAGDFTIMCNEFCGIGHHMMVGKVIVE